MVGAGKAGPKRTPKVLIKQAPKNPNFRATLGLALGPALGLLFNT